MDVSVGTRLRVLRKDAGLTQAQLAALAGTNQAAINRYETDRAAAPYRILVWYATYFNVSLDYIFGLCEDFPPTPYLILMPRVECACRRSLSRASCSCRCRSSSC